MLERLYVDNYRCLVNFECQLAAKQLILGPNGVGKSTLLDVLSLLRDFCVRGLAAEDLFADSTRTRWQSVAEQTFEVDVSGNGGKYTFRLVLDTVGSPARPRVVKEEVDFSGAPVFRFTMGEVHLFNDHHEDKVQYPFDWHRSALATITERRENTKLSWFKHWLGGLLCLSPDPRRMSALAQKETAFPAADLSNFADWYRHLRLESDDTALLADLRKAIQGFENIFLKEAGLGNRVLKVTLLSEEEVGTASRDDVYEFSELSDGQRVLVGLYTALHFALKADATIAFDEPDNFVALRETLPWLSKVLEQVEDAPAQVLIISHHPELINRMAFENGLLLQRPGGRHTRARRFTDPSQTGLSPAELVVRGWEE
jgi:ABC-type lipoprotein export system ATPase subunit